MGKTGKRVDYAQGACRRCATRCSETAKPALQRHAEPLRREKVGWELRGVTACVDRRLHGAADAPLAHSPEKDGQCPFATGDPEPVERRVPAGPDAVLSGFGGAPSAAVPTHRRDSLPLSRRARRAPFPVDLSDKFGPSATSCKVGEKGIDSAVYGRNLAESRARLASARAAHYNGSGGVVN